MDTKMIRRAGAIGVGLLLVGSVGTSAQQTVGGYTWEPLQLSDTTDINIDGVTELPGGGLVVFGEKYGNDEEGIAFWISADGGETWSETILDMRRKKWAPLHDFHGRDEGEETFDVAAHGDQLVAVRTVPGKTRRTFILTSPDGVEWTIADRLKNVHVEDIMSTPDGLAMHGLDFRKAKGFGKRLGGYPTLWTSDDGAEWEAHEITKPLHKPKDSEYEVLDSIARADDGTWMAMGQTLEFPKKGEPINVHSTWTAEADLEWTEVTLPLFEAKSQTWRLYESTPAGFLFGGGFLDRENGTAMGGLWLTRDGEAWEQVFEDDVIATLEPGPEDAVNTPSGVIAWAAPFLWTEPSFDDGKAQIKAGSPMWVSSDGRTWEHDPATDVIEGVWVGRAHAMPDGRVLLLGNDVTGCLGEPMRCAVGTPRVVLIGTPT